jgi:hypothetical protein
MGEEVMRKNQKPQSAIQSTRLEIKTFELAERRKVK